MQLVHAAQRRGAEVFAADLAQALRASGHEAETWALHRGDQRLAVDRVIGLPSMNPIERLLGVDARWVAQLGRAVNRYQPDIIQLNGASTVKYGAALAAVTRGRQWRAVYRNIGSPGFWLRRRSRRLLYRHIVMPQMDGVVALTEEIANELRNLHRFRCPVAVIGNGVSPERVMAGASRDASRASAGVEDATPVLAFVGALTAEKAPDRFLEVVEAVPGAVGWILGDGPLRPGLERQAARSGRIRFFGHVEHVGAVLAGADLLLCTSDSEGIPAAVLEAGLLGVPTVAFDVGGLAACVSHERTGLLVPPRDVGAIARAVTGLLSDRQAIAAMGAAAHVKIAESFTMGAVASSFETFYRQVLGAAA